MTQDEFELGIKSFEDVEAMRSKIYPSALRLINAGFVFEAHLLFLATWNFARFQYVIPSFNLPDYKTLIQRITYELQYLLGEDFATIDLAKHRRTIVDSFDALRAIRGIESTGASKVLHLLNPRVFVMWDAAISGWRTPKADYAQLDVIRSGFWKPPAYPFARSGGGYHDFLLYCQTQFKGLVSPDPNKTFAKCIDEFNYCSITKRLPARKRAGTAG